MPIRYICNGAKLFLNLLVLLNCFLHSPTLHNNNSHGLVLKPLTLTISAMASPNLGAEADVDDTATPPADNKSMADRGRDEYSGAKSSRFRFKSPKRRRHEDERYEGTSNDEGRRHGLRRRHHHRSKRRKRSPPDDPRLYNDTHLPNASSEHYLDPDTAFRESLFDAMADDEGAQFWEGVYGQPIPRLDPVKEGPTGELEAITDDEYAAHVRAEMFKKTHQHLIEEKERREKVKKENERRAQEARRETEEAERFRRQVEESLNRGRKRKVRAERAAEWANKWKAYENSWEALKGQKDLKTVSIPWPVWSGKRADIQAENIEDFFLNAPTSGDPDQADFMKVLKTERVRWHPDKIQQKLGGQNVDEAKMRAVTAVFQIIDRLWSDIREKKKD